MMERVACTISVRITAYDGAWWSSDIHNQVALMGGGCCPVPLYVLHLHKLPSGLRLKQTWCGNLLFGTTGQSPDYGTYKVQPFSTPCPSPKCLIANGREGHKSIECYTLVCKTGLPMYISCALCHSVCIYFWWSLCARKTKFLQGSNAKLIYV